MISITNQFRYIIVCAILCLTPAVFAGNVSRERAGTVAVNAYLERSGMEGRQMFKTPGDVKIQTLAADEYDQAHVNFYIANIESGGFIIIAGDDAVIPVLGYSFENHFDSETLPPGLSAMLEGYRKEMEDVFTAKVQFTASLSVSQEWNRYESVQFSTGEFKTVLPLLTCNWEQGCGYNTFCPADINGPCGHALVGCVALSMGQVMYYHGHPQRGTGSHSYTHAKYGTLSADFGATTYQWNEMRDNTGTTATARLLNHCGVAVEMDYGHNGSGIADLLIVENAFRDYFNYHEDCELLFRSNYSQDVWDNMLKTELDNNRPLFYAGMDPWAGGHAFNVDGYQGTNHFHINWGWGGSHNGYYFLSDLSPGSFDFSSRQQGVFFVQPVGDCEENISITAPLSGGNHQFLAEISITADNAISGGADVHYGAGQFVKLESGFKVSNGCHFTANTAGCAFSKSAKSGERTPVANQSVNPESRFTLCPNPATSSVTITMEGLEGEKPIRVYSVAGTLVKQLETRELKTELDVTDLSRGIYIVNVICNGEHYTERLVVE